jgi:hypothetical protein
MPITNLSHASLLNPGADLWVTPELECSKLTQRLDWLVNLQLTRAALHVPVQISEQIKSISAQCDLDSPNFRTEKNSSLLISTSHLLPNRWIVQIPESKDLKQWCTKISITWESLNKPSLRIFLPSGISTGDFTASWKELQSFDDFTLIAD